MHVEIVRRDVERPLQDLGLLPVAAGAGEQLGKSKMLIPGRLVACHQRHQRLDRLLLAFLLPVDFGQQSVGVSGADVLREQGATAPQRLFRLGETLLPEQGVAVRHLDSEVVRVFLRCQRQLLEIRLALLERVPCRRAGRSALAGFLLFLGGARRSIAERRHSRAEARAEMAEEPLVEVFEREGHRLLEHFLRAPAVAIAREHRENRIEAVVLLDPVADQGSLEVGQRDLVRKLGPHEAVVDLGDAEQLVVAQRGEEAHLHVVTPSGPRPPLLEHGQTLGQPARDLRVGDEQGERVGDLVPEGAAPVEVADLTCRRRVESEHRAEAHAESAETGQPHGANREVGVRRIDLHPDRRRRLEAVALGERRPGLLRQFDHVGGQQVGLAVVDVELEVLALDLPVVAERVEQVERVLGPDVVGVAREGGFQVGASGLDIAQPELVHAQQSVTAPGLRIDAHRLGGEVARLRVEPVVPAGIGQVVEQIGVAGVVGQHIVAETREVLAAPLEDRRRRQQSPGCERTRIDLQRLLGLLQRLPEPLRLKAEPGLKHPRRNQVRVDLQGRVEDALGPRIAIEPHRSRHRQQRLRMAWIGPQHIDQRRTRLTAVVLLEEQLADPDARRRPGRSERHRLVVGAQRVLEQLRIVAPQQLAGLPHRHEFLGRVGGATVVGVDHFV